MLDPEKETPFQRSFGEEMARTWGEEIRALEGKMLRNWQRGGLGPIEFLEEWRRKAILDSEEASRLDDLDLDRFLREKEAEGLSREIELKHVVGGTEFKGVPEDELYSRKKQQYLALIFGAVLNTPSFYIDVTISFLKGRSSPIQREYVMFGAGEFVQKCQAITRYDNREQLGKIIGNPNKEVFLGLKKLALRVEIETEDGERYEGDVSPLHMMDLIDSPEWSQRIMTSDREAGGEYGGLYYWRQKELVNELLCQRLKNERGQKLPKEAQIKSTNLYDFIFRQRIDNALGEERGISTRELAIHNLRWLYDSAWNIFTLGGRQKAWDKALEGRWPLSKMKEALLPANCEDMRHVDDLWLTERFLRVIQCYDLWSEEAGGILPIFRAEWAEDREERQKQQNIIARKVMRKGALPHLEEEESKIALGLGEYKEADWSERASAWLGNEENITYKGEMKSWEGMQNVTWTNEEREIVAEVDFRPALEMMQRYDPEIKIAGNTKGVEGYQQVVSQLSYQNLDYSGSGITYHTWARQMGHMEAAGHAQKILHGFFRTLTYVFSRSQTPIKESDDPFDDSVSPSEFWGNLEKAGLEAGEAIKEFSRAFDAEYMDATERAEAGSELLWAAAQAYTSHQRDWLTVVRKTDEGYWEEMQASTDDEEFPQEGRETLKHRKEALERLGYQFIRIGNGLERVFGPSGAPVRMLDRYEGFYCAAEERFKGRPLGWRFIDNFLGNATLPYLNDRFSKEETMKEIKARVSDEWPSHLPSEMKRGISGIQLGKRRKGKRIKI